MRHRVTNERKAWADSQERHLWFAWYPVKIPVGLWMHDWVWLEYITRRNTGGLYSFTRGVCDWEYS